MKVCQIDDMSGSVAVPLSKEQETDKFEGLAQVAFGRQSKGNRRNNLENRKGKRTSDLS